MAPTNICNHTAREISNSPFVLRPDPPAPLVPAKREDDEVQFVSMKPVKKRRLDDLNVSSASELSTSSISAASVSKPAVEAFDILETQSRSEPSCQPERSASAGGHHSQVLSQVDWGSTKGGSNPSFDKIGSLDNLWTAPSSGSRESPPISPKQYPQMVSPAGPTVESDQQLVTPFKQESFSSLDRIDSRPGIVDTPHTVPSDAIASAPDAAKDSMTAGPPESTLLVPFGTPAKLLTRRQDFGWRNAECRQDLPPHDLPALSVQAFEHASPAESAAKNDHLNHANLSRMYQISPPKPKDATRRPESDNTVDLRGLVHPHNTVPEMFMAPPNTSVSHATKINSENATSTEDCRDGSKFKGPCRKCLEARLRQQAAAIAATMPRSSPANPTYVPLASSSLMHPAWTPSLNMVAFANEYMMPAPFGQLLPSQVSTGTRGPAQHPRFSGPQSLNQNINIPPQASSSMTKALSMPSAQPRLQGPASSIRSVAPTQPPAYFPQTPSNGKHIIVDIADTCLEIFPFEAVAKRHQQPVQKIKDVFNAVIQVPLLRCPTDKRRAGKLGTARVKEYTQAKKDMRSGSRDSQARQTQLVQEQQQLSAWDVAQYMGPSDVHMGPHFNFAGPW